MNLKILIVIGMLFSVIFIFQYEGQCQQELPHYLYDRGTGVASSMFGAYIRKHDLIIYPYWEYYLDNNLSYIPAELGYNLDQEYRGRYRESEYLFFFYNSNKKIKQYL
jgi:hypothetical protein